MTNPTTSTLDRIRDDWKARGWPLTDLTRFRMEDDDGDDKGDDVGGAGGGDPAKTFTQAELDAIVKKRAAEAKKAGAKATADAVADALGCTVEEAKALVAKQREAADAEKSDAQKAREAADAERAAAAAEKGEAARERHEARVERLLVRQGIDDDKKLARVMRLVDVEVGADTEAIAAAVDALKEDMPELFGAPSGDGDGGEPKRPPANGDPKGDPKKGQKPLETAYQRGLERAKANATSGGGLGGYSLPGMTNA